MVPENTDINPHDWALDVRESTFQPIPISRIKSSHPRCPPAIVSFVVALDVSLSRVPDAVITVLSETSID